MAVARLTRVRVATDTPGLGRLVASLVGFGRFHPSKREGLVQDIRVLLWASRAQSVYGAATELLRSEALRGAAKGPFTPIDFEIADVGAFLQDLEEDLEFLARNLPLVRDEADRRAIASLLRGTQGVGLALFHDLSRLMAVPDPTGRSVLEGFVPSRALPEFRTRVGDALIEAEPVLRRGQDDPYVPTLLVNPRAISLFEKLTLDRGIPRYSEIDPTPIVALIFPLFFGIMFGDLGHGVTLLAVGLYLAYRTRYVYWGELITVFGIAAGLVGFARGVFFGVTFPTPLGRVVSLPPALDAQLTFSYLPLLLEAAILIGTLHLASAYGIAVLNQWRSRRYREALLSGIPTLALYASLVPLGFAVLGTNFRPWTLFQSTAPTPFFQQFLDLRLPVNLVAAVAAPVIVAAFALLLAGPSIEAFLSSERPRKLGRALREGLVRGVTRPLDFTLNTLSYVRLAALLVANTLLTGLIARVLVYGPVGVVVAVLLNLPLMAMEGLIVYLQDMRLHWLEWLSKFYAGTGTAFEPVALRGSGFRVLSPA